MSLGGYTEQAATLGAEIFTPLPNSSPQQALFDMSLNFGAETMAGVFSSLPPPTSAPTNPWTQPTPENQLALREDRSTVSMSDNSFTTSLASLQLEMSRMLTSIMTQGEQQRAADKKIYDDRETVRKAQCKIIDNNLKRF